MTSLTKKRRQARKNAKRIENVAKASVTLVVVAAVLFAKAVVILPAM